MATPNSQALRRRPTVRFAFYWVTAFLPATAHWLFENFGALNVPQLFYYLHFSSGLVATADNVFLVTFAIECVLGPTAVATLLLSIELYVNTSKLTHAMMPARFGPASRVGQGFAFLRRSFPVYALAISVAFFLWFFSVIPYVASMFGEDQFAKNYIEPGATELRATRPKNLVLIYVESLEAAYGDNELFGEDLLSDVNTLAGIGFASYRSAPGTDWTMAAIVATQCGVPLQFMAGTSSDATADRREPFLPHATCLGDILDRFGYRNVFLGGAHLDFAGKGRFLTQHRYGEVYGTKEWLKMGVPPQGLSGWGLYDDDLLRAAKEKLLELQKAGRNFNLTILTADTHQPKGHYSKSCRDRGAVKFEDIVRCTSVQLADFVEFAKAHDPLKNTNIVIVGDHPAHSNPVSDRLQGAPEHRIFNKFIAADLPNKNREDIVPFDLLPTLLEFIGIEVDGNRLALGCSAFNAAPAACPRLMLNEELFGELTVSKAYRKLWTE